MTDTMTSSPFLGLPAAVPADGLDAGVAAHYGNPMVEQRQLLAGTAIVDLSHRGVLSVTGPDRLSWLNSMTSQALDRLAPGESSETLVLDSNGRVEYDARVIDDGVTTWLLLEAAELPGLKAWLERMRFMLRVEVADETENYATIGSMAPDAAALAALALPVAAPNGVPLAWTDPWTTVAPGGWQYAAADEHPASAWHWHELLVPRSALGALAERVAAGEPAAAGTLALEALRIAAWRPRLALDGDDRTIPHELDWLRSAVHLSKGCYRGQETVAKVHNLGHPPRRLVMLHLDGSDTILPVHGDEVLAEKVRPETEAEWKTVGQITSAALHHELGPIALAVVKRAVPTDIPLEVHAHGEKVAAAQQAIVPTDAGAAANIPRLPRLGARGV
ncbi:folate-binding protein YgfZ [Microterricola pindariensis]|uniref:Folate-binding protein YgfZ n=2 Tax=Microterricola pindariensis TaxID=478010 RepID=A0ABX5AY21_9MICO|nr:folate-binding protein YgfZ [Microterricola pindariensis]